MDDAAVAPAYPVEQMIQAAGWEVTPDFQRRYLTDAWTYNLANLAAALFRERDAARAALTEAQAELKLIRKCIRNSSTAPNVLETIDFVAERALAAYDAAREEPDA